MLGFNLGIGKRSFDEAVNSQGVIGSNYAEIGFSVHRKTLNKFLKDKVFHNSETYFLLIEGIILNKKELDKESSWEDSIIACYEEYGKDFFRLFKGSFSGALYDRRERKWIIFVDQFATKNLFYYSIEDELYVTSSMNEMYHFLRKNELPYTLNVQASYTLLSHGYLLDDVTLCTEVKKLDYGSYIVYTDEGFTKEKYYQLPDSYDDTISEDQAIERLDELFREAIRLQFDKDEEYGYKHLVALSGGLDSRMVSWVAHEMGYQDQLNFTFSQTDYLDETIAKNIASDLKHEWIFKALDNGVFLTNIDKVNQVSGGHAIYYGLSHGYSTLSLLNFKELGIVHTGQLGDVIIGSYIKDYKERYGYNGDGAYSRRVLHKVESSEATELQSPLEYEQHIFKQRGINGVLTGNLTAQLFTGTVSPFCNVDFVDYSLKIPVHLRVNHRIYKLWMLKKYPKSAEYIWENTRVKISSKQRKVTIRGKQIPVNKLWGILFSKLRLKKIGTYSKFHMNPLDYWYQKNPELKNFQNQYFLENLHRLELYPELMEDCKELYNDGNLTEKNQVLTLLSALKLFFS